MTAVFFCFGGYDDCACQLASTERVFTFPYVLIHRGVLLIAHLISVGLCIHRLQISLKQQPDGSVDQLILFLQLNNKSLLC